MLRVIAVLLLLPLTGTSLVPLACVGLCDRPAVAASLAVCQHDQAPGTDGQSLSARHSCGTMLDAPTVIRASQGLVRHAGSVAILPALSAVGDGRAGEMWRQLASPPAPATRSTHRVLRI